MVCIKYIKI